jgi:hypothetical protein
MEAQHMIPTVAHLRRVVAAGSVVAATVGAGPSALAAAPSGASSQAGVSQAPVNVCAPSSNANSNSLINLSAAIPIQLLSGLGLLGKGTASQSVDQAGNRSTASSRCDQSSQAAVSAQPAGQSSGGQSTGTQSSGGRSSWSQTGQGEGAQAGGGQWSGGQPAQTGEGQSGGATTSPTPVSSGVSQTPENVCAPSSNANANSLLNLNLAIPIQLLSGLGLLGKGTASQSVDQAGNLPTATSDCTQTAATAA